MIFWLLYYKNVAPLGLMFTYTLSSYDYYHNYVRSRQNISPPLIPPSI
jgi:hypothetical protein